MKVPISLLLYKIKQKNNAVISRISQDISVGHPIFPDKAEKNKEHIVVVSNTQIPHFVAHKSFPLIVYADVDETVLQKTPGNYIAYPKGILFSRSSMNLRNCLRFLKNGIQNWMMH